MNSFSLFLLFSFLFSLFSSHLLQPFRSPPVIELQTMIGMGKFVDHFRSEVEDWQYKLGQVETVLKEWTAVTKQWAALETIFLGSADIRAQLPEDTKRFEGIDSEFKELMKMTESVRYELIHWNLFIWNSFFFLLFLWSLFFF